MLSRLGAEPPLRSSVDADATVKMAAIDGAGALGYAGRVLQGRYRIGRILGEGGMGAVHEAEHLELGKRVAIKIVHALHARDPHVVARLRQEARSTGAIESENIVAVFDAGDDEELGLYLVMELLKGVDLGALLSSGRRVPAIAAATAVFQAAQGLSRAHAAGIVHRDLKPANVFLAARDDGGSIVKLVDFGIAKLVRDASRVSPGLTQAGMAIGTPRYMSPEQAQGLSTVDHRTDVYSLGAVLFEAIAGASPFPELPTYEQTIVRIVTTHAPLLSSVVPGVDPLLDQLCADMMAPDPAARPASMAAVRARLLQIYPDIELGRLQVSVRDGAPQLDAVRPIARSVPPTGGGWVAQEDASPPSGELFIPITYEETADEAPAAPRRRKGPYLLAMGVVVLSSLLCMAALFKAYRAHGSPLPSLGYHIALPASVAASLGSHLPSWVDSVSPPPPVTPLPPAQTLAPAAIDAPSSPPAATATAAPSLAPAATVPPSPAPLATVEPESTRSKPVPPAASRPQRRPASPKPALGPRPVGGTHESTEF